MIAPKQITLKINGKSCVGQEGETILQVAQANDVYIPTLCHMKHLSPWGGCRLCIVEIAGSPKVVPSCSTPATDGADVIATSPRLHQLRRNTLELLFSERNHICPICEMNNGDCGLQHQGYVHGIDSIRYPYLYPVTARRHERQVFHARPQSLHPLHALRPRLRGNGRRPHARHFPSRYPQPGGRGHCGHIRHLGHLHQLRFVCRGLPNRCAVR